ncbi:PREDICTED: 5-hydroxytryptamine receptor 3A-like [Poecilia mexicana]|uniref:5-hydroxytryptamine receptor 3A-like n=1 Tax=Poecilia mexicana TaxID=48701 RepID=UPI00072E8C72|nr:PREDICTED: 5-hydroxytryptamine receptor 3A-like [Poecilia mexicana]
MYTMGLPIIKENRPLEVNLTLDPWAILDVREVDQTFVTHLGIKMEWINHYIKWSPENFCGIDKIIVPSELLWKPYIIIKDMAEKEKSLSSPNLKINSNGKTEFSTNQVVTTNCRMQVNKFPFDTQICNITFVSNIYDSKDLYLKSRFGHITYRKRIQKIITQYEWLFCNMTVHTWNSTGHLYFPITVKRRSVIYIVNFLLPILYLTCLDLVSFLMSDGEKVGFKITVLLAVTVMQLILNDILPSSSDSIPLIMKYCFGIFTMMMISLIETIFVNYLIEKDSASEDDETAQDPSLEAMKKYGASLIDKLGFKRGSAAKEDTSIQHTEGPLTLEMFSDELREMKKMITLLNTDKQEEKRGYWTKLADRINKIFAICYVISITVFLAILFSMWTAAENVTCLNETLPH